MGSAAAVLAGAVPSGPAWRGDPRCAERDGPTPGSVVGPGEGATPCCVTGPRTVFGGAGTLSAIGLTRCVSGPLPNGSRSVSGLASTVPAPAETGPDGGVPARPAGSCCIGGSRGCVGAVPSGPARGPTPGNVEGASGCACGVTPRCAGGDPGWIPGSVPVGARPTPCWVAGLAGSARGAGTLSAMGLGDACVGAALDWVAGPGAGAGGCGRGTLSAIGLGGGVPGSGSRAPGRNPGGRPSPPCRRNSACSAKAASFVAASAAS
jgi:hypothetical protein